LPACHAEGYTGDASYLGTGLHDGGSRGGALPNGPNASKAPGADGFTAGFFQKHWALVRDSVLSVVLGFLNDSEMPEVINHTTIVLIPKIANPQVPNPQELTQFRPISLCNVI
jgi:hypothetical protein